MALIAEPWFTAIAGAVRERELRPGQALFRQGDTVFGIFAVTRGRVRLTRHTTEGQEVAIHVASAGETFAEAALFSEVYHCDAVSDTTSTVAVVPKQAVLRAFETDAAAAKAFMARLARQVQALRSRLELRNIRGANDRLHQFLLLSAKAGQVAFERPLKDVAAEIGLTHEAFYRALASLARQGLIGREGKIIFIR